MPTGVATNRTHISLPTDVSSEILQKTQEQSAVMTLARQIPLPGRGVTIPVITSDPVAAWVGETAAKPVSNPGLSTKIMQAYKLAVIVPFSKEFRRDAAALYDALVQRLPLALAQKFDATVFGFESAPGDNFDRFNLCTAQNLSSNAYDGLVAADTDVAAHGGILNGYVISPQAKGLLLSAKDSTYRPLFINNVAEGAIPMILGAKTMQTKAAFKSGTTVDVIGVAGDWTQAMWGSVEGIEIDLSDQASLKLGDDSVINLFQQNMFAVRAEIEVGFRADTTVFNRLTRNHVSGATGATGATGSTGA